MTRSNLNVTINRTRTEVSKVWKSNETQVSLALSGHLRSVVHMLRIHSPCRSDLKVGLKRAVDRNPELYNAAKEGDHRSLVCLVLEGVDSRWTAKDAEAVYWLARAKINEDCGEEVVFEDRHLGTLSFVSRVENFIPSGSGEFECRSLEPPLILSYAAQDLPPRNPFDDSNAPLESNPFDEPVLSDGTRGTVPAVLNSGAVYKGLQSLFKE